MAKIDSNQITFVDITDTRKLDIYISSNLPTTQIYNSNTETYSPDWSKINLQLTADVYLDSKEITPKTIKWYTRVGTTETLVSSNSTLTISTNVLSNNPIITYVCRVEYQGIQAFREITFMRADTGVNGSDGADAPAVLAQYSADGATNWTSTINTTIHKYIRHSYDGGKTWTAAIKMVGEDGTSVSIKGTATSVTKVEGTDYYTLVYNSSIITGAELGDSYLYGGNLYVCADSRNGQDYFTNVGSIQGPKGGDGLSSYVFIRYATDANGTNMSTSPSGKTYMGVYTSNTNVAPTTANSYTWSKFVGDNAKSIILSGDSQVFKVSKNSVITPSSIKVTAQAFNTNITDWTYSTNGGQTFLSTVPTGVSRNGNIVTITGSTITSNSIVIKASDGTVEDVFTIYKAIDGADGGKGNDGAPAPIAFLTNENVTFSANAQGQISGITITSNVVAYSGTTKVTPTIGTISGAPTGMTITPSTVAASNEVMLTITIANNSTLGSASSNMGVISVPITYPVSTVLYLTWSKVNSGAIGIGIKSTTVTYGVSDSASTKPADAAWQSTIPEVEDGKYLWTRTIIDYNDDAMADTVTYTYAKQGVKGDIGLTGSSVTVSSIQYQESASATIPPTGTWSNSVVAVAEGKFLWTKTAFSDGKIAYGVAKQGVGGLDAYTVMLTNESHIFSGDVANAVAGSSSTQILAYKGATTQSVTIVSVNGKTASTTDTDTGIVGLKFKCSALSGTSPIITFTCTTSFVSPSGVIPIVLSVGGISFTKMFTYSIAFKGTQGNPGSPGTPSTSYWLVSSASAVQKTSTGTIAVTPSTLTFTGKSQTGTTTPTDYACRWIIAYSTDGTNYTNLYTSSANEASKTITVATTYKTIRARMYLAGGTTTLLDEQIIPVVVDGTSASVVDITPSAYYFKSITGKDGTFTPDYIYVYPRFQTVTFSKWEYSIDGGTTWVAASGANGLTIGTYNSIANTLRIAKTSTLYTDTVTSISFRCVSSNAAVYDTVSIAKIYDVVDLKIGGRNLLTNSGYMKTLDGWVNYAANSMVTDLKLETNSVYGSVLTVTGTSDSSRLKVGKYIPYLQKANRTLTFSMVYSASVDPNTVTIGGKYSTSDSTGEYSSFSGGTAKRVDLGNGFIYMECPINLTYTADTRSFFVYIYPKIQTLKIVWCKLEDGNKATDWTPAPEDVDANIVKVDTRITGVVTDVKTTTDGILNRVSSTEETVKTINNNVTSLTTKVSEAEQKITPTAIVSTVRQSTDYTNDLGKKVNSTEVISTINQTAGSVTINANKIGLLGATNIPDLTADKIKGGTLTLGGSSVTTKNGQILVKDSSDSDMVKMNKDGIFVESGKLSIAQDVDGRIAYDEATDQYYPTTNTSILELKDNEITMGIKGLTTNVRLDHSGLNLGGHIHGFGGYGSYIGNRTIGSAIPLVVQDDVQSDIRFLGASDVELARLTVNGFFIGGTDERSIVFANAGSGNGQAKIYKGSSSSSTVLGVWDDTNNRAVMRYQTDGTLFLDRPVNFGMGIQNKSRVLWSGMISSGNITLADAYTNYSFLTCIIGTTTITEGATLGAFYDIDQNELHFGSIFTGHNGLAGENLYGAIFTVPNMSNKSVINLARCGTKTTSGYYVKKIVGWI